VRTVYPVGTTIYEPDKCSNGYNLISGSEGVKLVDMNGRTAHFWNVDPDRKRGFIHRARLLENGMLMLLYGGADKANWGVMEFNWDGNETWSFRPDCSPHHDFWPKKNGSVLLICSNEVPEAVRAEVTDPERRALAIKEDHLIEATREGRIVWTWKQHEHLDVNKCNPVPASRDWPAGPDNNTITDWTHTNTIQALPENRWFDSGDARFRPGNVLISMRQIDTICIIDRESGEITWSYTGDYRGGLSGQHEPHMIERGLPGEGNIIVFDNGSSPQKDLAHSGSSYVLEIDPSTDKVVWVYDKGDRFYSRFTANCQRLPNGNTLILEALARRLFEVTPEKDLVWEHVLTDNAQRVYRYPYDHSPQTAALPAPRNLRVVPPERLVIEPQEG